MVLIRYRVNEGCDSALLVVEAEVGCSDYRAIAVTLEQVGQDAYEVARLLRLDGDQNLVLQEQGNRLNISGRVTGRR